MVRILRFFWPWFVAIGIFFALQTTVQTVRVHGLSMRPTLASGEYVLVNKLAYRVSEPHRGDIVVLESPVNGQTLVKRVVGVAGDTMNLPGCRVCPVEVGQGQVFVVGDNRPNSDDSRRFGPVDGESVMGKVTVRYWPPDQARWFGLFAD